MKRTFINTFYKNSILFLIIFSFAQSSSQSKIDSLRLISSTQKSAVKINTYLELANAFKRINMDSSYFYAKKVENFANRNSDIKSLARSTSIIAEVYQSRSLFKESIKLYQKAIDLAIKIQDKQIQSSALNGLGISHYYMNDLPLAEKYISQAAKVRLEIKDYTYYSVIMVNLASIYYHSAQYQKSIDQALKIEKVLLASKEAYYLSAVYNLLGGNYQMGFPEKDSAKYYYQKSLVYAEQFNIKDNLITGNHNLGELYFKKKAYAKALDYLQKAKFYAESQENRVLTKLIYDTLQEVYAAAGNYKQAHQFAMKSIELSSQIFESDKQKAISELEIKFETTKKENKLQKQQRELQSVKINAEKEKSKFYLLLFITGILLLSIIFTILYFKQRRKNQRKIDQEKALLFENIVHEIRTPLTLINGPLEKVQDALQNFPDLKEQALIINQNAKRLNRLILDLLNASQLEKNQFLTDSRVGQPALIIENLLIESAQELKSKSIQPKFDSINDQQSYFFNTDAFEIIAANLLGNAIKYTPSRGKIKLVLSAENGFLNFTVRNSGLVIPVQQRAIILSRFYRLEEHRAQVGSGIGLSIVKELIDQLKGELIISDWENQGMDFSVRLPIQIPAEVPETALNQNLPVMLLVEDDVDIARFTESIFNSNFQVFCVSNGEDGLSKAISLLPDIILTDVRMPLKDGLEMVQELKSNLLTQTIPVIVFSAKASLENRLKGLEYGADAYISKPFSPKELELVVNNLYRTLVLQREQFGNGLKKSSNWQQRLFSSHNFVNLAVQSISKNLDNESFSVHELADALFVSRSQLHRKLTQLTGYSASYFIKVVRLERSKDFLKEGQFSITEIAFQCGFNSQSYFTKTFKEYVGVSPSDFQKT
jgi:signal transduction histidine kinase/DNA-binding response OmpR family regulator